MKVGNVLKYGILSGLFAVSACKKTPYVLKPAAEVPARMENKINLLKMQTNYILKDKRYEYFGKDTLEITDDIYNGIRLYMRKMDQVAEKNTPKTKTGHHLENQMIPKTGGGFDIIPIMKNDYSPNYINQKAVITSNDVFTRNGEDIYVPVEYCGIPNPELK